MKNPRIVCDVTVFLEAALCPEAPAGELLRRFARERRLELLVSPELVSRLERSFHDPEVLSGLGQSEEEVDRWLAALGVLTEMIEASPGPLSSSEVSSADLELLALARAAPDAYVVTTDEDLAERLKGFDLELYAPGAILDFLDARGSVGVPS